MEKHVLKVEVRSEQEKAKHLRRQGIMPINLFGADGSKALQVISRQAEKVLAQISESTVLYLEIDGKEVPAMLSEIQRHPIDGSIIHASFHQVDLKQKVTAMIPVEVTGTFSVPGAYYHLVADEVEAEGLPMDLPELFQIDLNALKTVGDEVTYANLQYDRTKITLKIDDEKLPVLVVNAVEETVEEEKPTEEVASSTDTPKEEEKKA